MVELLFNDPWSFVVVIVSILIVFALYYMGKKKEAAKLAYELIVIAEEIILGNSKGNIKLTFVYEKLYLMLPKIIRMVYSEEQIYRLIDNVFEENKQKLENYIVYKKTKEFIEGN